MNCRKITYKNGKHRLKRSGGEQGDWLMTEQTGGDLVSAGWWGPKGSGREGLQGQR